MLFLVVHGTTWLGELAGHAHEAGGGHAVAHAGPVSMGAEGPEAADALGLATVAVQCLVLTTGTSCSPGAAGSGRPTDCSASARWWSCCG